MKPAAKKYFFQFSGAMGAYAGALIGSVILLENNEFSTPLTVLIALVPMIPVFFVGLAIFTFYGSMDEFQKRILSEATIASALVTGFGTFAYGFLEGAVNLPAFPIIWIMPMLIGLQGLFSFILKWRYR
jgi:O-antigen/teichoic acid export membrane protein